MFIIAIDSPGQASPAQAQALAAVLQKTAYEVRPHLTLPGGGPCVVSVLAEEADARALARALQDKGFSPQIVTPQEIERLEQAFAAREFALHPTQLQLRSRQGDELLIPFAQIRLLLRGMYSSSQTQTQVTKQKKFSMGRAVMTGGLMLSKTKEQTNRTTTQENDAFVALITQTGETVTLREHSLVYDGLGKERQPSRAANFTRLVALLRQSCPQALYDDRLLRKATQRQMLGASLDTAAHLDVALLLLSTHLLPNTR